MNRGLILRIGAAAAILISGIVHLDLYFNQDYRFASPDVNFGRSILLNAVVSGAVAVALVAFREWFVKVIALLLVLGTMGVFLYTHAEHEFLGYSHGGPVFEPSPQAKIAFFAQLVAIVLLVVSLLPGMEDQTATELNVPAIGIAFALAAIALGGLAFKWRVQEETTAAAAPTAVVIKGFAFAPAELSVPTGTTITWTNDDSATHSVVAEDTSFVSDDLTTGASYSNTFTTAGTFAYICGIHPRMKATVTVTG